jgi:hypothetical protein
LEHPLYRRVVTPAEAEFLQANLGKNSRYGGQEEITLQTMHGASIEQIAWRRHKIDTDCFGHLDLFHQEYPTTPSEAFLTSGRPALDHKRLAAMPIQPGLSGELQIGDEFPKRHVEFVPRDRGSLTIWKPPQPGRFYVMGSDPSNGKDVSETGEQVALLRERMRPGRFADYSAVLGQWYNWAFWVPESNFTGFIDAILNSKYPQQFIYIMGREPGDLRPAQSQDVGFYIDGVSRTWLVGAGEEAIRTGAVIIRSQVALQECYTLEIKPNGKIEHRRGCHDDCFFAMALAEIGRRAAPKRKVQYHGEERRPAVLRYGVVKKRVDDDD